MVRKALASNLFKPARFPQLLKWLSGAVTFLALILAALFSVLRKADQADTFAIIAFWGFLATLIFYGIDYLLYRFGLTQSLKSGATDLPEPGKSPAGLFQKGLALGLSDHGFVLLAVTMSSVFSFLSNLAMAKVLNISDYGVYVSCIALFSFVTILVTTIQSTIARLVAQEEARNPKGAFWFVFRTSLFYVSLFGTGLFVALLGISPFLASFLKVDIKLIWYVLLGALFFAPYGLTLGSLQGLQYFRLFGLGMCATPISRLPLGILLALSGLGLTGAVLALPLALVLGLMVNLLLLSSWRGRDTHPSSLSPAKGEILGSFLSSGSFVLIGTVGSTFLTMLDVILVQHFFAGEIAGNYAAIATLGKIVLYFASPVTLVLLPKVSQAATRGNRAETLKLLRRALLGTVLLSFVALAGLVLLGGVVVRLFVSNFLSELVWLIALHGGAMLLYSLVAVWVAFFIAVKQRLYLVLVLPALGLQIGLIFLWHSTLAEVVWMLYVAGGVLYLGGEFCLRQYLRQRGGLK